MSPTPAADKQLGMAIEQGIHCLSVPTPFAIGPVNAYLIEGRPLTLVDSGPNLATAMATLERALRGAGYGVEDLELLVITHQHVDHFGLAQLIAERSGAEVACLGTAAGFVGDFEREQARADDHAQALMLRHGIDPHVVDALRAVANIVGSFGASVHVDRPLDDGDDVVLGSRKFRVLHRPGHSPSDTVFHDRAAGILLAGDHLLSRVSSNALVTLPLDAGDDEARTRPLVDYRRSLEATRALDLELVLGGHGPAIADPRPLIDARLRAQEERALHILGFLRADGPLTAHEIASRIWHRVAITQAYLTLSEVIGHLDLLIAEDQVQEDDSGAVVRFEEVRR